MRAQDLAHSVEMGLRERWRQPTNWTGPIDALVHRLERDRVIYAIDILFFVLAAWQAVGFDWAFVALGGDAMLYLEIVSVIYLMALRGFTQQIQVPDSKSRLA